ncbi:Transcription initiation factor TFIID subunit 11b [Cardamine amara subsp. amara]|uniref:Transcription initiation factor TFIID subunit 11b n=1 Tax=Cardamine amara subsp. amara TaxID=228776 RepID=A0ABD1AXB1_CARAN
MKHSKDPFEASIEEEENVEIEQSSEEDERNVRVGLKLKKCKTAEAKKKYENEEEENMEVELNKYPTGAHNVKKAKMQIILSQFTEEQMSRYESVRRSAFHKSNMKQLLKSITGSQKIDDTMIMVVCGIAKMFVGELVETARIVMGIRKESGPIRPCHIRESYRRLKLEGKVPRRSVSRLFR